MTKSSHVLMLSLALFFTAGASAQDDPQQPPSASSPQTTVPEAQRPQQPRRLVQQPQENRAMVTSSRFVCLYPCNACDSASTSPRLASSRRSAQICAT